MPDAPVPDLPEPSAALMLILAITHAHLDTMPRKKRDKFLLKVSQSLGMQEASLNVLRFRPRSEDRAVYQAMKHAKAWWSQAISVVIRLQG